MRILLKQVREQRNLSIRQVEILTKVSKSTISDIETGKVIPRLDVLEQLAAGLKVKISDLIESEYL